MKMSGTTIVELTQEDVDLAITEYIENNHDAVKEVPHAAQVTLNKDGGATVTWTNQE